MARKSTPSFVLELPLRTTATDERALAVRLDAARNIYNACLGEALRRRDRMRESKAWQAGRKLAKGRPGSEERKARAKAFKEISAAYGFTAGDIQRFAQQCRDACWIKDHLGGHDTQTTSLRAFRAVEQYAFGKRGRPRFRRFNAFNSVEGKEAKSTVIFRDNAVAYGGLKLPVILDPSDAWQAEALKGRTKYCRIIRRQIRGRARWYVQFVQEGTTPLRRATRRGVVGLDIGPSTVAAAGSSDAAFEPFCPSVIHPWKEQRRIERAMDRSRRATNPECFNADGTWKKGVKARNRSKRYQALALKRRERERRLAAERKRCHGELANRIIGQGTTVKTERLSYRALQRSFGKSSKVRGAGMFVSTLARKLEAAGGQLIEFGTRNTCLSQFDHVDGTLTKKPLSQRYHAFSDGTRVGRDLYSAFLARFVHNDRLDASQVRAAWPGAEALLRAASDGFEPASGRGFALPHVTLGVGAGRSRNSGQKVRKAGEVYPQALASAARAPESGAILEIPDGT
jgi:putative transposase